MRINKKFLILPVAIVAAAAMLITQLGIGRDDLYYGEIEPEAYDVYATVSGIVEEVLVKEGERLEEDQVVLRLEDEEAALMLKKAELAGAIGEENVDKSVSPVRDEELNIQKSSISQLRSQQDALKDNLSGTRSLYAQSQSNSEALRAAYELQKSRYQQMEDLFASGAVSKETLDNANLAMVNAGSAYDSARLQSSKILNDIRSLQDQIAALDAQLAAADERLKALSGGYGETDQTITALSSEMAGIDAELARLAAEKYAVKAHNAGVVESINYEKGEFVRAGAPVISLYDPDKVRVRIYIHEEDLLKVSVGQELGFRLEADPGVKLTGTVESIATEPMFTPMGVVVAEERERLVYRVEVSLAITDEVRPGMLLSTDFGELE